MVRYMVVFLVLEVLHAGTLVCRFPIPRVCS